MKDRQQLRIQTGHALLRFNWPMGLTTLRLLLLPLFLWIVLVDARWDSRHGVGAHHLRWVAVGVFAVMAITDKLDGYLARRFNQTSKLGALLDPIADKLLITCSVILLSFNWIAPAGFEIPIPVMLCIYGKDLCVVVGTVGLLSLVRRVQITPRLLGKVSTGLQLALILSTLVAEDVANVSRTFANVGIYLLWWAVSLVAAGATADYAWQGIRQYEQYRAIKARARAAADLRQDE